MEFSNESLMEEVQSVILETDELEYPKKPHAYASFGNINQSSFHWEQ